ncbi:MAG: exopolyphosphatase / guanosine-5'-triphosphate,3'-diphosphate pyrophosphatase [Candidatus Argoarchaeum ethanivorans]|uniref:Exopolyphosphatase / guanosine-5'-triphosphate,3'-diphosphate pyrophosphatase n=1 Tax=Candidatus Argoarchaeum ethanivorans TaxID=2608793 RepID=A0A8B3S1G7_9EURY|nr:MAG: exopolyphosphatase / guanosine-5'-triphosphate,3'-diphosphate pyrophosphatase [Candidatus Argoarchaeum ethanivorans]
MASEELRSEDRVIAFINLGTNSIRMLVVRIKPNQTYAILREEREIVRPGEHVFSRGCLRVKAMKRAVLVCQKFIEVTNAFNADEIVAVATSATREAKNRVEFLEELRKIGLNVKVVSGKEEARLIYLGVSSGVHIEHKKTIFIDIGGGSTEIAMGNQFQYQDLDTLELGAIRLSRIFLSDSDESPVSMFAYKKMKRYARNKMLRTIEHMNRDKIELAIGSSGTIINLAEIARKMFKKGGSKKELVLEQSDLKAVSSMLCSLPLAERKEVPGINADRADIIIGGAVILETLMEAFALKEIVVSNRGLRHGLLVDYLQRHGEYPKFEKMSVREKSVLRLGKCCNINEDHANTVASLALQLFDSSLKIKLHDLGDSERELLKYSVILHDTGNFISFQDHHIHSHYIISHAELLGFNQTEITIMANVARFHRKRVPRKKETTMAELDEQSQMIVTIFSTLLKFAEKLDRSHTGRIKTAKFTSKDDEKVVLSLRSEGECDLERWGIESVVRDFEKVFERGVKLYVMREESHRV